MKKEDLNNAWSKVKEALLSVINKHASLMEKIIWGRECQWLSPDIRKTMIDRDYYLRKAHTTGREID